MDDYTYEYLPHRGLTKEVMAVYGVKAKIDKEGKPVSVGFQYPDTAYKVRYLDKKDFYWTNQEEKTHCLFGRDKFSSGSHKWVIVTEGEYDALSLYQVCKCPVVSVQSASSAVADCTADRSWLNSYERVYLAFDADAPGRDATAKVARLFDYNKVFVVRFDQFKDANEYLQHGRSEELRNIFENSKRFLPENIISSFDEFKKILEEPHPDSVSYPWRTLTEKTYGIRTGESVLITAQEGVGKTEIMHAIEYHLLRETPYAVGAIFLEEPKRRHLQALGGIHLKKPVHLPDCNVREDEVLAAIKEVVAQDDRLHVYSHFGSDDPEVLIDTVRFLVAARGCRYILLDHITMAVSGLAGENERRALDYLSTRLEMLVKELDFALLLVSHVNDDGLTRGSRYISKIADIRIDATRDVTNPDLTARNRTYLNVSKNRFCGRTGNAGTLLFDPLTYTYTEEGNNEEFNPSKVPYLSESPPIWGQESGQEAPCEVC